MTRNLLNVTISIFALTLYSNHIKAQSDVSFPFDYECQDSILQLKFISDHFAGRDGMTQIRNTLYNLGECGLDSIDVSILLESPFIRTIPVNVTDPNFRIFDLIKAFEVFKQSKEYSESKKIIKFNNDFLKLKVDLNEWSKHAQILQDLGYPQDQISKLKEHIISYRADGSGMTYKQLMQKIINQEETPNPDYENLYTNKFVNLRYSEIEELAKNSDKQVLIYFRNLKSQNCTRLESQVLNEFSVTKKIADAYIFVEMNVEDPTPLPKTEHYKSHRKNVNTLGKRNMDIQITKFQNNAQPYFVRINSDGEKIADISFPSAQEFIDFLNY